MTSPDWPNDDPLSEPERASTVDAPNHSRRLDAVFELLANERSRDLLSVVYARGGTESIEEVVDLLAARWTEPADTGPTPEAKRRVRTAIHHAAIPQLSDRGVVDYDPVAETVSLTESGERLEPYLEFVRGRERADGRSVLEGTTNTE